MSQLEHDIRPVGLDLSRDFSAFASSLQFNELPDSVVSEAKRGILDWLGCAIAGSHHPTIDRVLAGLDRLSSVERVPVIGRARRLGVMEAAIANGQIGHVLDFDDTHMDVFVLHTSSPSLAAMFSASAVAGAISGCDFVTAYVLAFEAGVRVGQAAPTHQEGGWHLTGTLGTISASIACGRILGLSSQQMNHALGLGATQASGMKQNRGTMAKSFHAGRAASNGVLSALLAMADVDSSQEIIEGRRGFASTYSQAPGDPDALVRELGADWKILRNGYKAHACGIVLHPLIDAMIGLRRRGINSGAIEKIELVVHPAAMRITGVVNPKTGLEAKFSISHAAAASFLDGHAGIEQFSDARARDPKVVAMRRVVTARADESLRPDEARARITFGGGQSLDIHIPHALGTSKAPMDDDSVELKFLNNAKPVIGVERAQAIVDLVRDVEKLDNISHLLDMCSERGAQKPAP